MNLSVSNFVKPWIKKTENYELLFNGVIGKGRRTSAHIPLLSKYNYITNPLLVLKLSDDLFFDESIDLSNILSSISFEIGGNIIDRMYTDQINIFQHKYNLKPMLIDKSLIVPLPFNSMLKSNGFILPHGFFDARFFIDISNYEFNKYIEDGHIKIDYSQLDNNFDMSEMTKYYYNQMLQTKAFSSNLLKINGSYPSDYQTYYLIEKMLKLKTPLDLEKNSLPNILISRLNKPVEDQVKTHFSMPFGLMGIKQNQFTGLESVNSKSKTIKIRLNFSCDVELMHICLKLNSNICKYKWFDTCTIKVNGSDVLTWSYEHLVYNTQGLPQGVLFLPHMDQVNFMADNVSLFFNNTKFEQDTNNEEKQDFTFFSCAESSNFITIGTMSELVFGF